MKIKSYLNKLFMPSPFMERPEENRVTYIQALSRIGFVLSVVVTFFSGGATAYAAYHAIVPYLPKWLAAGVGGAVVFGMYLLTDKYFKPLAFKAAYDLVIFLFGAVQKTFWEKYSFGQRFGQFWEFAVVCGLITGMVLSDKIVAIIATPAVATFVPAKERIDVIGQRSKVIALNKSSLDQINKDVARLEKEKQAAFYRAGNKALRKLESEGNGWAANQLQAKRNKATKPYAEKIEALEAQKIELLSNQTSTIAKLDDINLSADMLVVQQNARTAKFVNLGMEVLGFWTKVAFLAVILLATLHIFSNGLTDLNGDGQVDEKDLEFAMFGPKKP